MNFHKIKMIIAVAIASAFYGCSSKSADPEPKTVPPTVSIIGKWNYAKDSINFFKNGSLVSKQVIKYSAGEYMTFNSNGTGSDGTSTFTYTVSGSTLTIITPKTSNNSGSTNVAQVQLLSTNKLNLYYDFIQSGNNSIYASLTR